MQRTDVPLNVTVSAHLELELKRAATRPAETAAAVVSRVNIVAVGGLPAVRVLRCGDRDIWRAVVVRVAAVILNRIVVARVWAVAVALHLSVSSTVVGEADGA